MILPPSSLHLGNIQDSFGVLPNTPHITVGFNLKINFEEKSNTGGKQISCASMSMELSALEKHGANGAISCERLFQSVCAFRLLTSLQGLSSYYPARGTGKAW